MEWSKNPQFAPGWWIYKNNREWVLRIAQISKGDWRLSQDPDEWYWGLKNVTQMEPGLWFGPIPKPATN